MFTYFMIGIAIQLIIYIERAIRFPWVYKEYGAHWQFWVSAIAFGIFNVMVWPITIVSEIYNVANGQ